MSKISKPARNPCFGILRMSEKQFDSRLCNFSSHDEDAEKWSIGDVQNPAGKLVDVSTHFQGSWQRYPCSRLKFLDF